LGIAPSLSEEHRRDLVELCAVRNVIVHRAGIVDKALRQQCPWFTSEVGEHIRVGQRRFQAYVAAASELAASIIVAARGVRDRTREGDASGDDLGAKI
jgi:hypothetical protein